MQPPFWRAGVMSTSVNYHIITKEMQTGLSLVLCLFLEEQVIPHHILVGNFWNEIRISCITSCSCCQLHLLINYVPGWR